VAEDYTVIDQYFTEQISKLKENTLQWKDKTEGTDDKAKVTAYFDELTQAHVALRDHVATYQYALPTGLFAKY
jgi:hypothetical protein